MQQTLERLERGLNRLADARPAVAMLFLFGLMLVVLLPMQSSLPPIDRDEVLFAQASRQMAESGDWVDIRFAEETRYKKPVGIYWLQAASAKLFGGDELGRMSLYRLPSLLGAIGAVLGTYAIGLVLFDRRRAFLAALLMGGTLVLAGEARLAKTDAVLLLAITLAQLKLAIAWVGGRTLSWTRASLFWIMLGVSVLIKGPIGVMVVGLTAVVLSGLNRDLRWLARLRILPGFAIFAAVVLPWYVAITLKSGTAFWDEALGRDLLGKVASGQESHGAPPGTYLLAVWLTFWPAVILVPLAIMPVWRARREPAIQFLLAWLIPTWLVFEVVATKLVHYVLPTYPALALLVAFGWSERMRAGLGPIWLGVLAVIGALGLIYASIPLAYSMSLGAGGSLVYYAGFLLVSFTLIAAFSAVRQGLVFAPVAMFPILGLGVALTLFGHLSRLDYLWPARTIAKTDTSCPIRVVGFSEPSLVFTTGNWAIDDPIEADDGPCLTLFVEERVRDATLEQMSGQGWMLQPGESFAAMDLGKGRDMTLTRYDATREGSE